MILFHTSGWSDRIHINGWKTFNRVYEQFALGLLRVFEDLWRMDIWKALDQFDNKFPLCLAIDRIFLLRLSQPSPHCKSLSMAHVFTPEGDFLCPPMISCESSLSPIHRATKRQTYPSLNDAENLIIASWITEKWVEKI
jgi:hypothetical protein